MDALNSSRKIRSTTLRAATVSVSMVDIRLFP